MYKTDLAVNLGGLRLKNPVMPASGAYGYFESNANLFPMSQLGAVVIKSVHRVERIGNPLPRMTEVLGGIINAVGIPSVGIEKFITQELEPFREIGTSVVLSLSGNNPEHYIESAEILNDNDAIHAIELNLSCPNVDTGLPFSTVPDLLRRTVSGVRAKTKLPLLVKLSPNVSDICPIAQLAEECGADALVVSNTYRAMKIDLGRKAPVLGNISGGMSGPAIKPQTMYLVYQTYKKVHIPIIACGGIAKWQDAVEYILAGAKAVQVGSVNFANPMIMPEIISGIDEYLFRNGYKEIADIVGLAHLNQ